MSTGEGRLILEAPRDKLKPRFERITLNEREKDYNEKALAAELKVQFKRTCHKFS